MIRPAWRLDILVAVIAAAIVLIVSPGLAISGLLAILVLLVCGITAAVERRRQRRAPAVSRRRF